MRAKWLFTLVIAASSSGIAQPPSPNAKVQRPSIELRVSDAHVRFGDDLLLSTLLQSREVSFTLWNSFGWSSTSGFRLQVLDPNGNEVKSYYDLYDVVPPSENGAGDLVTIGGNTFVGFYSRIPTHSLFPKPGRFILKCFYTPPLPRRYFRGITIWGKEDGLIESPPVKILVEAN